MATLAYSSYPTMRRFIRIRNRMNLFYHRYALFCVIPGLAIICLLLLSVAHKIRDQNEMEGSVPSVRSRKSSFFTGEIIYIFQGYPTTSRSSGNDSVKNFHQMKAVTSLDPSTGARIVLNIATPEQQRKFLEKHGAECYHDDNGNPSDKDNQNKLAILRRYDTMNPVTQGQFQNELWKYCALAVYGGAYLDADSPLLETFSNAFSDRNSNYAVIGSTFPGTIHGSVIFLTRKKHPLAIKMVKLIVETDGENLDSDPLLLQRNLYQFISQDMGLGKSSRSLKPGLMYGDNNSWTMLEQRCSHIGHGERKDELGGYSNMLRCPFHIGYCCEIHDPTHMLLILVTRHPTLPSQFIPPPSELPQPFTLQNKKLDQTDYDPNLPYITTIREQIFPYPKNVSNTATHTPNFFEILQDQDCLPDSKDCSTCLRNKLGANCDSCASSCPCFCEKICSIYPEQKFIRKNIHIQPPLFQKDPSRIIPRIVHQTWFEPVTKEKYPNMSRLIESWKQSGWEYRFYDDNDALEFLSTHFPPEIREAYESITPGAFKADLFRYCALLINGGVYADMDVLLEASLDAVVSADVGFMTPVDEPGSPVNRRMCLWNGFIASAPAHPYISRVIEIVVNNIRNRFTSVDVDSMLCPNPELSISHAFDTLFTAGPCILGTALNSVLKRHFQTSYVPGDIDHLHTEDINFQSDAFQGRIDQRHLIPGRTIILDQNKHDMGAHRFTWLEQNMVVAATDMPDYDDRKTLVDEEQAEHYSKSHVRIGIYGLENLYVDHNMANEDLRFFVRSQKGVK